MSDHTSVGERYARASVTGNLRMQSHTQPCDADKLLAAGYAQRGSERAKLGLRLYRMQVTGDRESLSTIVREADTWLRRRLSRKGNRPLPAAQRDALVVDTLRWWLNQRCEYCNGTGFDMIEGTPALSVQECTACTGTGITPLKRVVPQRLLIHAYWLAKEWDVMCAEVIGDMALLLKDELTLSNAENHAQYAAATNAGSSGDNTKPDP